MFNEELEKFVTKDDNVISSFKYSRRSNFKPAIANTVGIFEDYSFFRLMHTIVNKDFAFWFTCAHEQGARQRLN